MENAPISPESTDKKSSKEKSSDKKKRREIGSVAVERKERKAEVREESRDKKPERYIFASKDAKSETVKEAEAPVDGTLSKQEKAAVAQDYAENATKTAEKHDPATNPEAAAGDMLVEEFHDRLKNMAPEEDIESVANEVAEGHDLELPREVVNEAEAAVEAEAETAAEEGLEAVPEPDEELVFDRSAETPVEDAEDEPDDATSPSGSSPTPTATTPAGSGAGGTGGTPPPTIPGFGPTPPIGPGGPTGPFGPLGPGFGGLGAPGYHPAAAPTPARAPERSHDYIDDRASPAAMALAGGIIGYLIGRRRGRIKTEKKLLPIQKKLEKQVEDLHWQIKAKETKIRKAAAEKVRQQGPSIVEAIAARQAVAMESRQDKKIASRAEREADGARRRAPEANILHGPKAPEHIGHMLMTAESLPTIGLERKAAEKVAVNNIDLKELSKPARETLTEKKVETLSRGELLEISDKISVGGSTLRQIYETHLVGERGLRRLIAEHLRGGDLGKALRREIVEREIDFERDPAMRDIATPGGSSSQQASPAPTGGGQAALNQLVQKAVANLPANEEVAFHKARADYESDQLQKHQQRQQVVDVSFGVVIAGLVVAIIYLAFFRG